MRHQSDARQADQRTAAGRPTDYVPGTFPEVSKLAQCTGAGVTCRLEGQTGATLCSWGVWRCGSSGAGFCARSDRCESAGAAAAQEELVCGPDVEGTPCQANEGQVGVCGVGQLVCSGKAAVCQPNGDGQACEVDGSPGRLDCSSGHPRCLAEAIVAETETARDTYTADCLLSTTHPASPPWIVLAGLLAVWGWRHSRRRARRRLAAKVMLAALLALSLGGRPAQAAEADGRASSGWPARLGALGTAMAGLLGQAGHQLLSSVEQGSLPFADRMGRALRQAADPTTEHWLSRYRATARDADAYAALLRRLRTNGGMGQRVPWARRQRYRAAASELRQATRVHRQWDASFTGLRVVKSAMDWATVATTIVAPTVLMVVGAPSMLVGGAAGTGIVLGVTAEGGRAAAQMRAKRVVAAAAGEIGKRRAAIDGRLAPLTIELEALAAEVEARAQDRPWRKPAEKARLRQATETVRRAARASPQQTGIEVRSLADALERFRNVSAERATRTVVTPRRGRGRLATIRLESAGEGRACASGLEPTSPAEQTQGKASVTIAPLPVAARALDLRAGRRVPAISVVVPAAHSQVPDRLQLRLKRLRMAKGLVARGDSVGLRRAARFAGLRD
jgi:hypothetical protein